MSNEKMREEFEAAVLNSELLPCNSIVKIEGSDEYSSVLTGVAWKAWKASRAALCVNLPRQTYDYDLDCDTMIAHHVGKALDAAGVRYK